MVPNLIGVVPDTDVDGDGVAVVVQLPIQGGLQFQFT
jgi:hypothetical protein